jgi:hypothetical protein
MGSLSKPSFVSVVSPVHQTEPPQSCAGALHAEHTIDSRCYWRVVPCTEGDVRVCGLMAGHPNAVWTVRMNATDTTDAYIVVSFVNATLVLSIGTFTPVPRPRPTRG